MNRPQGKSRRRRPERVRPTFAPQPSPFRYRAFDPERETPEAYEAEVMEALDEYIADVEGR